jgi:ATP-dependent RNA helicase DHX8/PRP22
MFRYRVVSAGNDYNRIRRAIAAGYFNNVCKRDSQEGYRRLTDDQQVFIHPSSALYQRSPEYVVYHELVFTAKEYIREVCTVEASWLPEIAPNLFQKSDGKKLSRKKQLERIQPLHNKFEEKDSWRLTVRMGQPNL